MNDHTPSRLPKELPSPTREVDGNTYWVMPDGGLKPDELVRPMDKLKDEVARKIVGHFLAMSEELARLKQHTFHDIAALESLLGQDYGVSLGGEKGNMTVWTHDGQFKVQVSVADKLDFGPELLAAKSLIDECLTEWSADARPELRAVVTRAFNTDKPGKINRNEIFGLLRWDIQDPRWQRAMDALRDAIMVVGSTTYVRCYHRPAPGAKMQMITLDLANA